MTTQAASMAAPTRITPRRIAAGFIWAAACWTTYLALTTMGASHWLIGVVVQAAFTAVESQIWQGKYSGIALIILLADTLINAGGMWQWLRFIDKTPAWLMLIETLGAPETLGSLPKLAIACIVGLILAYMPETIWRSG